MAKITLSESSLKVLIRECVKEAINESVNEGGPGSNDLLTALRKKQAQNRGYTWDDNLSRKENTATWDAQEVEKRAQRKQPLNTNSQLVTTPNAQNQDTIMGIPRNRIQQFIRIKGPNGFEDGVIYK